MFQTCYYGIYSIVITDMKLMLAFVGQKQVLSSDKNVFEKMLCILCRQQIACVVSIEICQISNYQVSVQHNKTDSSPVPDTSWTHGEDLYNDIYNS